MSRTHTVVVRALLLAAGALLLASGSAHGVAVDHATGMLSHPLTSADAAVAAEGRTTRSGGRSLAQTAAQCKAICSSVPDAPVCGKDGQTYENGCYAICAGNSDIEYPGKCVSKPCLCALVWAPVCGNGKSWINSCFAKCNGVTATKPGYCAGDCQQCPTTKAPVCGLDGKTYNNWCAANCAGTTVVYSGACDSRISSCKCSLTNDPVCVTSWATTKLTKTTIRTPIRTTYGSPCLAGCSGNKASTWTTGACQGETTLFEATNFMCGCSLALKPVCTQLPMSSTATSTVSSKCVADCLGYKTLYDGVCKDECLCPATLDPVCVGGKTTYKSPCLARCQGGATSWTLGACTPCSKCPAATAGTYVCGKDGLPYGNQCLANCVGVQVASKGYCVPRGGK